MKAAQLDGLSDDPPLSPSPSSLSLSLFKEWAAAQQGREALDGVARSRTTRTMGGRHTRYL